MMFRWIAAFLLTLAALSPAAAHELASEDYYVESTQGLKIFVRNKWLPGQAEFGPGRTLLFIHGATYPASAAFDLPLDGRSWMDDLAAQGYDVYLMDLPGYGRSQSLPELGQPAEANPPVMKTAQAIEEFGRVVDSIRARRGIEKLNVMGWSWGTTIVAGYTAANPGKVEKLALVSPLWVPRQTREDMFGELGAWRAVTKDAAWSRWIGGLAEAEREAIIPRAWFDTWWAANMAAAPRGAALAQPRIIAPNGVLADIEEWVAGRPLYNPADITVPVLIAVGDRDVETPPAMTFDLFGKLMNAPVRRAVTIGNGTHALLLERSRDQLFREVQLFLDE